MRGDQRITLSYCNSDSLLVCVWTCVCAWGRVCTCTMCSINLFTCVHTYFMCLPLWVVKTVSEVTSVNETSPWGRSSGLVKTQTRALLYNPHPLHPPPINSLAGRRAARSRQGCEPRETKTGRMRQREKKQVTDPTYSTALPQCVINLISTLWLSLIVHIRQGSQN